VGGARIWQPEELVTLDGVQAVLGAGVTRRFSPSSGRERLTIPVV
jgi:hypothetical protein